MSEFERTARNTEASPLDPEKRVDVIETSPHVMSYEKQQRLARIAREAAVSKPVNEITVMEIIPPLPKEIISQTGYNTIMMRRQAVALAAQD